MEDRLATEDTPVRWYANTPVRRHADTPIRSISGCGYAATLCGDATHVPERLLLF
jgi:hypothetical protein